MKRRLLVLAGALLAMGGALLLWLGPGEVAWSLRAAVAPSGAEAAWRHVPPSAPGLATCRLAAILGSPIGRELRPELETLAALQGADLGWFEARLEEVLVVHDGESTGYAIGRRLDLSPLVIARFDERWGPVEGAGGRRGASDGLLSLFPLEPGLVLATEARATGRALQLATDPAGGREPLLLDQPGEALRAELTLTPALRARFRRLADARALPLVEAVDAVDLRVLALDELEGQLELSCRDQGSAEGVEALLRQLDFAARAARQAGGLADALLGRSAAALKQLPPLELGRTGAVVRVEARLDADALRPWLRRAIESLGEPS